MRIQSSEDESTIGLSLSDAGGRYRRLVDGLIQQVTNSDHQDDPRGEIEPRLVSAPTNTSGSQIPDRIRSGRGTSRRCGWGNCVQSARGACGGPSFRRCSFA